MALSKTALLEYLQTHAREDLSEIKDDTTLFSSGIIDSFAMVEMLVFLEAQTGGRLGPEDISLENLDTVESIMRFAASRTPK